MSESHETGVEALGLESCLELLRGVSIGRVGWATESGRIVMLPVNFVVDGDEVVFRSGEGSKLAAVRAGRTLAFEADDVEPALHAGWSVLVTGRGRVVTEAAEIRRLEQLPLSPWVAGLDGEFVRLAAEHVTGRRLPLHPGGVTVEHIEDSD